MGERWKVSVRVTGSDLCLERGTVEVMLRKGKQIRSVNKLLQEVYLEMITAWAKAMPVCAHREDVPFRALTKSTLESISRFWWRLFPWATKETSKHGRDSEKKLISGRCRNISQATLA